MEQRSGRDSNRPDYLAQALAKVAQAQQEFFAKSGDVEKARALVRLREAEHDLTVLKGADSELEGDKKRAEAQVRLRKEQLRLAELEGDKKKTAEAQVRLRKEQLRLAELEDDKKKTAEAQVRLSKDELKLAELEGNKKKTAEAQVQLSKDELKLAELEGDDKKTAEAQVQLSKDELKLAKFEGNKKKTAEAQVQLSKEELKLAKFEGNDKKTAEAQVQLSKDELKLAKFEGDEELAHAKRNLTEANLNLSVATVSELLRNATGEDAARLSRELEVARYALISHQCDGAGKFLSVLCKMAAKVNVKQMAKKLRKGLKESLDGGWKPTSSWVQPSKQFSDLNPINKLVMKARNDKETYVCLVEACSGSGKSLCAADYFVRNVDDSILFLFNPVEGDQTYQVQPIYQNLQLITQLMSKALECDLSILTRQYVGSMKKTDPLTALNFNFSTGQPSRWHVLGVLGWLWDELTTIAPVSIEEAAEWKTRWVLVDEVIPPRKDDARFFSIIAKLVFLKRLLTNSGINCIMLGTNTLVMNFVQDARVSEHSREAGRIMLCLTHRSLPPYILPSKRAQKALNRIFGEALVPKLLDCVNPMICDLFVTEVLKDSRYMNAEAHVVLRRISLLVHNTVRARKPNWRVESKYCMFQIAAHEAVSQLHISQGFAQLNIWKMEDPPARDSDESIVEVSIKHENPWMEGTMLSEITSRFPPAVLDPITTAVCAGGGRPFSNESALAVLQMIHKNQSLGHDPLSLDAWKRDGNLLESFGAVVMMISSWSRPQNLLKRIAFHCGITDERSVNGILASIPNKEIFAEMLTSCVSNLVPVKESEQDHSLSAILGFYTRNKDVQGRDGTFAGPTCANKQRWKGGAEFKNLSSPLAPKYLFDVLSGLVSQDLDVNLCMVSALSKKARKRFVVPRTSNTEWLVLHLRAGRKWFATVPSIVEPEFKRRKRGNEGGKAQTGTRKRVLIIVEIGLKTEPFCGSARLVTESNAPEATGRLDSGIEVSLE